MKKLIAILLCMVLAVSLVACGSSEPVEPTADMIREDLQGIWELDGNTFTFAGDSVAVNGSMANGTFVVNTETKEIDCTLQVSDGTVMIHSPYEYVGGKLKLYNNNGGELVKID